MQPPASAGDPAREPRSLCARDPRRAAGARRSRCARGQCPSGLCSRHSSNPQGASRPMNADFLPIAVTIVAFLFSVIVHENAHGLAAEHFGDPTARALGRITMNPLPHLDPIGSVLLPLTAAIAHVPLLGWAKPVPVNSANFRNPVVHNAYVAA